MTEQSEIKEKFLSNDDLIAIITGGYSSCDRKIPAIWKQTQHPAVTSLHAWDPS